MVLHSFIQSKRQILIYDGKNVPSFGDINFRLLETDGSTNLTGNFFDGHHPEETVALGHCRINETGTDIGDGDVFNVFSFFIRALTLWIWGHYHALTPKQVGFLILQDELHSNDDQIARAFGITESTVRIVRSRIKRREK